MGSDTDTWHSTQGGGILSCDWSEHLNTGLWLAAGYLGGMMTRWNVHLVCRVRQRDTEWGHSLDMIRDSDWSNNLNTGLWLAEIFTGQVAVTTCHNTDHTYTSASSCSFEKDLNQAGDLMSQCMGDHFPRTFHHCTRGYNLHESSEPISIQREGRVWVEGRACPGWCELITS